MALNYKSLLESYQADPVGTDQNVRKAFKEKAYKPQDVDFGRLFEACFGWQAFRDCRNKELLAHDVFARSLQESAGAVMTTAFQTITQNFVNSTVLEAYDAPELIFQKLIPTRQSKLRTERIPGIGGLGRVRQHVPEGEPFPLAGVTEEWQDTPVTKKYGFRTALTWEAVFFDQTGILVDRISKLAASDAYDQELAAIQCIVDRGTGAADARIGGHRYNYKGSSYASYQATTPYVNIKTSNTLLDYTDIENTELLFDAMTDPTTGLVTGAFRAASTQILVPTSLVHTAKQILHATQLRMHVGGYATSGNLGERSSPNTLQEYQIVSSPLLSAQLETATDWHIGNIGKACEWIENSPLETKQAPSNSADEFERDIVMQWRVSRVGAYYVRQPRFLVKSTVA